ncbi:MAG: HAD family hydrolase [Armatimonadetes bacterium]|nr:HAD family hydrolase [Armatimonadota bacterium]
MRAVLFDLDGTLVLTHIDFSAMRAAVVEVVLAAGIEREAIEGLDTLTTARHASAILRERHGEDEARDLLHRAEESMIAVEMRGLEGAEPAPFAREVLRELADQGIALAIVTRNCRRVTEAAMALCDMACPVVLSRDDVPRYKPDPAHLLDALQRLDVAPAAAVMVGDHPMDIQAGRAAGTRTVGVVTPGRPPDYFVASRPDRVIADLRGLLPFVFGAT